MDNMVKSYKKGGGRPIVPEVYKKKNVISLRLDNEEFSKLEYLMAKTGKSASDILRKGIEIQAYENHF